MKSLASFKPVEVGLCLKRNLQNVCLIVNFAPTIPVFSSAITFKQCGVVLTIWHVAPL